MRDRINADDIANTVSMLRSSFKGTIVVVEGSTDSRLYGKFLDKENTETVIAHCRQNVSGAVKESVKRKNDNKVIGIIDSDLDRINNVKKEPPIFQTDARDSEGMMFMSSAFDDVIAEYSDEEKLSAFVKRYGDPKKAIYNACYPLGILMQISDREGMNLSFKNPPFEYFIDRRSLKCDIRRMCEHIADRSENSWIPPAKLTNKVFDEKKYNPVIVCRGHDIADVFALALRETFGSYNAKNITGNQVSGALRLAYDKEDFRKTDLFSTTDKWAEEKKIPLWNEIRI